MNKEEKHSFRRSCAISYGVEAAILLEDALERLDDDGTMTRSGLKTAADRKSYLDRFSYIDVAKAAEVITDISRGGDEE